MAATSQSMLNQALFEDQEMPTTQIMCSSVYNLLSINNFTAAPNMTFPLTGSNFTSNQSLIKGFSMPSNPIGANDHASTLAETMLLSSKQRSDQDNTINIFAPLLHHHHLGAPHLLSLQRSSKNLWAREGEEDHTNERLIRSKRSTNGYEYASNGNRQVLGVGAMKMKKIKGKKVREPRFCFKTPSEIDVLDDGYKWRKYGQKVVNNTQHPRSYYRCTQDNCRVKKRVERLAEDPRMVLTTYEGRHAHSPSHDLEDSQSQSQLTNFFF